MFKDLAWWVPWFVAFILLTVVFSMFGLIYVDNPNDATENMIAGCGVVAGTYAFMFGVAGMIHMMQDPKC